MLGFINSTKSRTLLGLAARERNAGASGAGSRRGSPLGCLDAETVRRSVERAASTSPIEGVGGVLRRREVSMHDRPPFAAGVPFPFSHTKTPSEFGGCFHLLKFYAACSASRFTVDSSVPSRLRSCPRLSNIIRSSRSKRLSSLRSR